MTTIIEALEDPALLGSAIADSTTYKAWWAALKAIFGLPMSDDEASIYRACTGRQELPTAAFAITWLVIGRRGSKSLMMAVIAVYQAVFKDWRPYLSPGERAVVLIVAADKEQAKVVRRYIGGILSSPMFAPHVQGETSETIDLKGSVAIEVATCSFRTVRGRSVCVALLDEVCFWRSESTVNPDKEVWRAIRASMATFGKAGMAFIASSPYSRRGIVWEAYKRYFGQSDATNLIWQASTQTMNPTISGDFIRQEYEADPASAAAEYGAEFRSDLANFVSDDVVQPLILNGVFEIAPKPGVHYSAFADAASGSGADSYCLGIAFKDGDESVLAYLGERRPPFDPEAVTAEYSQTLKRYGVTKVVGDKWATGFVEAAFRRHGIQYESSAAPKSDLYKELMPLLNTGKIKLLDNRRMISQLLSLERKTARGGRDSIDHPDRGNDDAINAACGALVLSSYYKRRTMVIADVALQRSAMPGSASRQPMFGGGMHPSIRSQIEMSGAAIQAILKRP